MTVREARIHGIFQLAHAFLPANLDRQTEHLLNKLSRRGVVPFVGVGHSSFVRRQVDSVDERTWSVRWIELEYNMWMWKKLFHQIEDIDSFSHRRSGPVLQFENAGHLRRGGIQGNDVQER